MDLTPDEQPPSTAGQDRAGEEPTCPLCGTAVHPDWDWCQGCGFDPDGLRPPGWSAQQEEPLPRPAPAVSDSRQSPFGRLPPPPFGRVPPPPSYLSPLREQSPSSMYRAYEEDGATVYRYTRSGLRPLLPDRLTDADGRVLAEFRLETGTTIGSKRYRFSRSGWQGRQLSEADTGLVVVDAQLGHQDFRAESWCRLPDNRVLRFPVWGDPRFGPVMVALDQSGCSGAQYRMTGRRTIEIVVPPRWLPGDWVLPVVLWSAPLLHFYFHRPRNRGG